MKHYLTIVLPFAILGSLLFVIANQTVGDAPATRIETVDQAYSGAFFGLIFVGLLLMLFVKNHEIFILGLTNLLLYCAWGLVVELPLFLLFEVVLSQDYIVLGRIMMCLIGSVALVWCCFPLANPKEDDGSE